MGRILDGREDLVAVTVRGVAHWGMVGRHGIRHAWRPDWERFLGEAYGTWSVRLHRLMGDPLSAEEERRTILSQIPARLYGTWLKDSGRCRTLKEADRAARRVAQDPTLTTERLRELSFALERRARIGPLDYTSVRKAVEGWLEEKGFLGQPGLPPPG